MIKLFNVFEDLWTEKEKNVFAKFTKHIEEKQDSVDFTAKVKLFKRWSDITVYLRKVKAEIEQREKVIEILKTSTRCQRTTVEKETLRRFVTSNLTCVPKSISFSEMDQLCNELDWIPLVGRSILFLQGDFGNIYYMIAHGSVGLYLEPSKDREMTVARDFGGLRSQPFLGTNEDLNSLGNNIFNLPVSRTLLSFLLYLFPTFAYFVNSKERVSASMRFWPHRTRFAPVRQWQWMNSPYC
jgi:hypothetical protein